MRRIVMVEDSPLEADALHTHLDRYAREHNEAFSIDHLTSALEFVERRPRADLILMDIDMPGLTGMEAAEVLREYDEQTPLIFVTNLAQYAVHGYAVDALDFIVKPIEYQSLCLSMDRALRAMRRNAGSTIAIPAPGGTRIVPLSQVEYVDILRHDLYWHLAGGEVLRVRGSIKAAAEQVGDGFVRVSASCLANMAQVQLVRQASVVMAGGEELFFSRGCRKAALESLASYVGRSI